MAFINLMWKVFFLNTTAARRQVLYPLIVSFGSHLGSPGLSLDSSTQATREWIYLEALWYLKLIILQIKLTFWKHLSLAMPSLNMSDHIKAKSVTVITFRQGEITLVINFCFNENSCSWQNRHSTFWPLCIQIGSGNITCLVWVAIIFNWENPSESTQRLTLIPPTAVSGWRVWQLFMVPYSQADPPPNTIKSFLTTFSKVTFWSFSVSSVSSTTHLWWT